MQTLPAYLWHRLFALVGIMGLGEPARNTSSQTSHTESRPTTQVTHSLLFPETKIIPPKLLKIKIKRFEEDQKMFSQIIKKECAKSLFLGSKRFDRRLASSASLLVVRLAPILGSNLSGLIYKPFFAWDFRPVRKGFI